MFRIITPILLVTIYFTSLTACQSETSGTQNQSQKQNEPAATMSTGSAGGEHHDESKGPVEITDDFAVMVLGSGGPAAMKSGRASAGYLIFINKKPRILMDAGGGTFQRLAQSGINIKDLDIVLLSHLHIDHTADLSAFIKTIYFHNRGAGTLREAPIRIYGPGANKATFPETDILQYPATSDFINGLYAKENGVYRYLNIFAKAISGGDFSYKVTDTSSALDQDMQTIIDEDGLVVKAIGVRHGPVPAVAYRIEYGGKSIVFSGDTNSSTDNMIKLATNSDLLIYDTAVMDDIPNGPNDAVFFALHTKPSRIGEVAAAAMAKKLVLSHLTGNTEPRLDQVKELIRAQGYTNDISVAEDLKVYKVGDEH